MSQPTAQYVVTVNQAGLQSMHKITLDHDKAVVIGRSWRSDIVVNDEYIDPAHLKLSVDSAGALHVQDLNTRNGTRLGKRTVQQSTQYANASQLHIGDSTISIYNATDSVAPALRRDTIQKLSSRYHSFLWYALATLAALAALAIGNLLLSNDEITNELVASTIGTAALTALSISIVGGLLSKLFRQKTLFGLHYIFACWMFFLVVVATLVWDIVAFNIEPGLSTTIIDEALWFLLGTLTIFGVLSMISRVARYKRLTIALVALGIPTAFQLISPMLETDYNAWSDRISMDVVSQPPLFQFKPASSVASHLLAADKLFAELDKEVDWEVSDTENEPPDETPAQSEHAVQVSEFD